MRMRLLSIVSVALCSILTAFAEQIQVPDVALAQGGSVKVEILLSNEYADLVAFQMDLRLPVGVSIDKEGCELSSRITDEKQELVIGKLESGGYRLISNSMSLTPIYGTEGALLILTFKSDANFVQGEAVIDNILFSTSGSERVSVDDVSFTINTLFSLVYKIDGVEYKTATIEYGALISPEAEPTKEGYTFRGWSGIPETMPAHNVVIAGSFSVNKYLVTYMYFDQMVKTDSVAYGSPVPMPEIMEPGTTIPIIWLNVPETMPAYDIFILGDMTDKIESLTPSHSKVEGDVYDLNGRKLSVPKQGINIIRMSDGSTRKMMIM